MNTLKVFFSWYVAIEAANLQPLVFMYIDEIKLFHHLNKKPP